MIDKIYYSLPHNLRRFLYARLRREDFQRLQKQKHVVSDLGYSLKPFVENQCIFVHIPKTAGVSVCQTLFHNLAGGHQKIARYQLVFSKKEFNRYFKFTFVRNPWDRLYSAYNFLKKGGIDDKDRDWALANLSAYASFDDFVKNGLHLANMQQYIHFTPQYQLLCLPNSFKIKVDFVGFFENIEDDFMTIKNRLALSPNLALKYENRTKPVDKKTDYRDFYTDETREIVAEIYKKDIELFGYNFDNSSLKTQLANRAQGQKI